MIKFKFKVLIYLDRYVDEMRLYEGICIIDVPRLHKESTTIEQLKRDVIMLRQMMNMDDDTTSEYIKNLKQCKLVEVELTLNE